jgi:protoheme IX farnesyltransferase
VARPGAWRIARAYLELTKPRIVMLILMTGGPALLMAARGSPPARAGLAALLGTALAAAAGSCLNHYFDRDLDARMLRTMGRPLPSGILAPSRALGFGFLLAGLAGAVLATWANLLAAAIAMAGIFHYAVVYSVWLKRRTSQNVVIGGAAGASAPLIAWAAVTGHVEWPAIAMAAIIFCWTPPHFWALALICHEDYLRAGLPMLPLTHGEEETRGQIAIYSVILLLVTLIPVGLGAAGWVYGISALALGAGLVRSAFRLASSRSPADAVRLFRYSILYLFLLYAVLTVDALLRWNR